MKKKNAVAYLRTATDGKGEVDRIALQEQSVRKFCAKNDIVLDKIFIDRGKSGLNFDRPGWREVKDYLAEHKSSVRLVVTPDIDRIGRNPSLSISEIEYFQKHFGVEFKYCTGNNAAKELAEFEHRFLRKARKI